MLEAIQQFQHALHGMMAVYVAVTVCVVAAWMLLWASKKDLSQ